ncbi:hypothetical protein ACOSP7_019475 [Xanthoceras sorbifolium]
MSVFCFCMWFYGCKLTVLLSNLKLFASLGGEFGVFVMPWCMMVSQPASSVVQWAASFVGNIEEEPSVKVGGLTRCKDIKRKLPNKGCFKLNLDAGIDESFQHIGIGVVIRDSPWSCYGFVCSRFGFSVLSSL